MEQQLPKKPPHQVINLGNDLELTVTRIDLNGKEDIITKLCNKSSETRMEFNGRIIEPNHCLVGGPELLHLTDRNKLVERVRPVSLESD